MALGLDKNLNKKTVLWIFGISVLMGLTVWAGWTELIEALYKTDPLYMFFLLLLQFSTTLLVNYQWKYIIERAGNYIGFWKTYILLRAGYFVELVTPSSKLGGEAAKIILFRHNTEMGYTDSTAVMLAQKYISLIPFLAIASIFTFLGYFMFGLPEITFLGLGFLALIVLSLVGLAVWSRYWDEPVVEAGEGLINKAVSALGFLREASYESSKILSKKDFTLLFSISIFIWLLYPVKVWIVGYMLGYEIGFVFIVVVTYVSYLVSLLPITPGGLGTFEGSMAVFFSINGFSFAEGLAIALVSRVVTYWFPLLISFLASIYLSRGKELPVYRKT
ncbi:lysylphosphatidylglycerol synthase transmembrane domain-containing protein [Methanonatronarchaeum sp. AMET-Sl]|uniref:lysylphosphatidylglycerol synthase transmembrane domain-containing protein n=1 Tax=Methanonatronarchaeum sp. AMET-Sl TaxID=3037654 RepID=UPI00244DF01E|nr:lysylphosphatidylglycerol synthase transmembrane domain-containing protein [Methanonatronarchaeum sp. AMET-Sl]WGI18125.1 lysylphosphatidylglycerol synthase transmembrane domain-containing protein [Methanonatronarchaeum sp. AMET-Sl]